jgi:CRP/FNR family cyclic AMP-dependent transcriptional regulator
MLSVTDHVPALLRHIDKHISITASDKEYFISLISARRLMKRQYLLQEGKICKHESFVVSGCLRSFFVDKTGDEHTLQFSVEDWWVNDLDSFLNHTPSQYNIEALEPCILLEIDHTSLNHLYSKVPAFERYFRILHQRAFIAQNKRILNNISLTGMERYKAFLEDYPSVVQRVPQKYIASYLGITPVFLSQIRNQRKGS